jgi:hypothetical protein
MLGTGVLNDWFQARAWILLVGFRSANPDRFQQFQLMFLYDHKVIGIQYGITSLILLLTAGLFGLIFRTNRRSRFAVSHCGWL